MARGGDAVGMIRLIVAARARRWWRAWLAIAVLVSVTGGAVLAALPPPSW